MSTRPEGFWTWIKSCYEKVIKALTLSSSSLRASKRESKKFLKTMEVAGDWLHPLRVALAELEKGADLGMSKEVSLVETCVVQ